jgi:hypothetical protein
MINNPELAERTVLEALKEGPKSGEMLTYLLQDAGVEWSPPSAIGPLFTVLHKQNKIKRIGYCQRARCGGPTTVWSLPL